MTDENKCPCFFKLYDKCKYEELTVVNKAESDPYYPNLLVCSACINIDLTKALLDLKERIRID